MSKIKQIIAQEIGNGNREIIFRFDNDWHHAMTFSKFDDPRDIARKLVALSNDILHNENLDAPGLSDSAIDPEFFRDK